MFKPARGNDRAGVSPGATVWNRLLARPITVSAGLALQRQLRAAWISVLFFADSMSSKTTALLPRAPLAPYLRFLEPLIIQPTLVLSPQLTSGPSQNLYIPVFAWNLQKTSWGRPRAGRQRAYVWYGEGAFSPSFPIWICSISSQTPDLSF